MGSSSGWWGLSCPAHCRSCFSLLRPASLGFPLGLSFARFACRSLLSLPAPRDTAAGDWELVEDVAAGHSTLDPVDPSNGSKPGRARPGVPSSSSSILPSECLPLLFLGPAARHSQSRERRPGGVSRTVNHPPLKPPSGAAVYIVLQTEFSQEPRFFQSFGGSATASRRRVRQECIARQPRWSSRPISKPNRARGFVVCHGRVA